MYANNNANSDQFTYYRPPFQGCLVKRTSIKINIVVKVRRGPTFSPSRKVMTELPYPPEARV